MNEKDFVLRAEYLESKRSAETEHEMLKAEDKRQNDRIDKLEIAVGEIHELAMSVNTLATNMEHMLEEIKSQGKRLSAIEAKDGDMWRSTVKYIITAIAGIIIGFVFKGVFG